MTSLDIVFRSMDPSPAVEDCVHDWLERLERRFGAVERCTVVIDQPHRHHRQGRLFEVHVHLDARGETFAITHDAGRDHAHEDVYIAIADAFRSARRALDSRVEIRRGDVKLHA